MGNEAEKKASAAEPAKASRYDDDERVIRHEHNSTNGSGTKAPPEIERLSKLLVGNPLKHVRRYGPLIKDKKNSNKWVHTKTKTVSGPADLDAWTKHFFGEFELSQSLLFDDGTVRQAVIDIDVYELDYYEIHENIKKFNLPLIVEVTKSGGLHLRLVLSQPAAMSALRPLLDDYAKALGFKNTKTAKEYEIFPRSDVIPGEGKTVAAVSLPYCGMDYGEAVTPRAINRTGGSLLLNSYTWIVEHTAVTFDQLPRLRGTGSGKTASGEAREVNVLVNKLSNETRELLKEPHHPNRSDACWTIITEMINRGFSDEEIVLVLREYPNGPARHYTDKNSSLEADIRRIRAKYKRNSFVFPEGTLINKNKVPYQNVHNVALTLQSPGLDGLFTYDEIERKTKVTEPLPDVFDGLDQRQREFPYSFTDADCTHMQTWFQTIGMRTIAEGIVGQGIYLVARNRSYHPIKQHLELLKWDGKRRLNTWLSRCFGVSPDRYHSVVGRKFLLSMIARIYRPGCKVDYMMVLVGKQGVLKSTVASTLAGKWFSDNLPSLRNEKDAALHLNGKWLIEVAELAAIRKQANEQIKTFITRQVDKYRPPYGRNEVDEPRQCVFLGTTNDDEFLHDETGGRRYWPVTVVKTDLEWLRSNRDQLFAESMVQYNEGENWWPDNTWLDTFAKPEQDKYQETDAWEEPIKEYLERYRSGKWRVEGICLNALDFTHVKDIKPQDALRVRKILIKLKWEKRRDKKSTYWVSPRGKEEEELPAEQLELYRRDEGLGVSFKQEDLLPGVGM
jgi:predicted P-loop ATPase